MCRSSRASFGLLRRLLWGQGRANLGELGDALGVPRMRRMPDLDEVETSYAFSPLLVPPPSDWPDPHRVVGSVLPNEMLRARLGEAGVAGDVQRWLDAGPAPVYFGFGLDARLPDHVLLVDGHVDHAAVLPRCLAAVHHGGSSTTAAVAAVGLPSVVVSVLLDQSFWGSRVEHAGVGVTFPFRRWSASRLERSLSTVLGDQHRERSALLAHDVAGEDGATRTAELIESGG